MPALWVPRLGEPCSLLTVVLKTLTGTAVAHKTQDPDPGPGTRDGRSTDCYTPPMVLLTKLPAEERWTYKGGSQIDYLLVSQPLWDVIDEVGVERRGIYRQSAVGNPDEMFSEVKGLTTQASDHGTVWVDLDL